MLYNIEKPIYKGIVMTITIAVIIVVIIAFIIYKKRSTSAKPKSREEQLFDKNSAQLLHIQKSDKYWGLYINYENQSLCCSETLKLQKKLIPKKTAPALPLKGCDKTLCRCHYVGVVEKRNETRREALDRRDEIRFEEDNDRRSGIERRSSTWVHHED